jgi:hypothetical protein
MTTKSVFHHTFSIDNHVLDGIYEKILPRIHQQVNKLTVEPHSMERVLSFDYPQLYSLSLVDFQEEMLFKYLTGIKIMRLLDIN